MLRRVAATGTPAMRALAVLGLGVAHDTASVATIAEMARSGDAGNAVRAAAAHALGDLDATARVPTLVELAEDGDDLPRRMAIGSLARMMANAPKPPAWSAEAVQAMADAVFTARPDSLHGKSAAGLARTAVAALASLAVDRAGQAHAAPRRRCRSPREPSTSTPCSTRWRPASRASPTAPRPS